MCPCVPLGSKPFEQGSVTKHEGKTYEVHYVARMWAFEPSVLRVPTVPRWIYTR